MPRIRALIGWYGARYTTTGQYQLYDTVYVGERAQQKTSTCTPSINVLQCSPLSLQENIGYVCKNVIDCPQVCKSIHSHYQQASYRFSRAYLDQFDGAPHNFWNQVGHHPSDLCTEFEGAAGHPAGHPAIDAGRCLFHLRGVRLPLLVAAVVGEHDGELHQAFLRLFVHSEARTSLYVCFLLTPFIHELKRGAHARWCRCPGFAYT